MDAPPYGSPQPTQSMSLRVWCSVGKGGGGLMRELDVCVLCVSIVNFFVVPLQ